MKLGFYKHYKGNVYVVTGTATHSETLETLVIYHPQFVPEKVWVRPYGLFNDAVIDSDLVAVSRFSYLES